MNSTQDNYSTLERIKNKSSGLLASASKLLENAITVFKKDEVNMSTEEKIEKQHMLIFIYGMGAGIVIYHFLVGAVLLLGILWFYSMSLKKTKILIEEQKPKKRTYKKRTPSKKPTQEKLEH